MHLLGTVDRQWVLLELSVILLILSYPTETDLLYEILPALYYSLSSRNTSLFTEQFNLHIGICTMLI